jgi:hypothetical protein
MYHASKSRG